MLARRIRAWPHRSAPILALALAAVGFLGLAAWQLERRAQKHALVARVEARVHASPAAAPARAQWPGFDAAQYEYRHVRLRGRPLDDRATFVHASTVLGMGYWVLTPLLQDDGSCVLVNRGFVAAAQRAAQLVPAGPAGQAVSITGLLRLSEPGGSWLRANRPEEDAWFSRDVAAIAARRRVESVAPFFVDADAATPEDSTRARTIESALAAPVAGLTVIAFPDNHLAYALTWLALAMMSAAACVGLARARPGCACAREPDGTAGGQPCDAARN